MVFVEVTHDSQTLRVVVSALREQLNQAVNNLSFFFILFVISTCFLLCLAIFFKKFRGEDILLEMWDNFPLERFQIDIWYQLKYSELLDDLGDVDGLLYLALANLEQPVPQTPPHAATKNSPQLISYCFLRCIVKRYSMSNLTSNLLIFLHPWCIIVGRLRWYFIWFS